MTGKVIKACAVTVLAIALAPQAALAAAPKDPAVQKMESELQQIKGELKTRPTRSAGWTSRN